MSSDIIRLMTDEDIIEGMRIRLEREGFRKKTVTELLEGAKKIIDACPREQLCEAVFAENPEKEIRPLLDKLFPSMSFNKIGWYGVALRILGDSMRKIASRECSEEDLKKLKELNAFSTGCEADKTTENYARKTEDKKMRKSAEPASIAAKKAARRLSLPFPTAEDAREVFAALRNDPEIVKRNDMIKNVIAEVGPENTDPAAVLAKIEVLTSLCGPVGMDNRRIAEQIAACNIDEYLQNGDEGAVEILTNTLRDKKQKDFYMFAVRYCVAHNPDKYPNYNAGTVRALKYCRDNHGFYNFSNDELSDYSKYKKLLGIFRKKYSMKEFSLSEISWILTISGKLLAGK